MSIRKLIIIIATGFLCTTTTVQAQPDEGGQPLSFSGQWKALAEKNPLARQVVPPLDIATVRAEDERNGMPTRFAAPIAVNFSPQTHGQWLELPNGDRIWRLQLSSSGALALAALYDNFYLPPGAKLYMYSLDQKQILGAFTRKNNPKSGRFWTGLIEGSSAVIEYFEPAISKGKGHFNIFRIDYAYDQERLKGPSVDEKVQVLDEFGFGTSFSCHINANCTQGTNWADQKRSTCRIFMVLQEGLGYCSGALINNTANDGAPYILTAYHCQGDYTPYYDMYRFDFNYQGATCSNPATEPNYSSMMGAIFRAERQPNDFALLELSNPIPAEYNVFFSGWNRADMAAATPFLYHHPRGDIKKISGSTQNATIYASAIPWGNGITTPANHHFRLIFSYGAFEPGSSGCSLYDNNGRIVGQLHGGTSACLMTTTGYFGRLALSWDGGGTSSTRLKDWLDPLNLGLTTLNGINQPVIAEASVQGLVQTPEGDAVAGATVTLASANDTLTMVTDVAGQYSFTELPAGIAYTLSIRKTSNPKNGVSTQDLILIRKHILNVDALDTPFQHIASDVNASETVTTNDLIQIQKVILSVLSNFEQIDSWRFLPLNFDFANPSAPLPGIPYGQTTFLLTEDKIFDWMGVKSGDVNNSADPGL